MGKGYRFFETFAVGLALACVVLVSQSAYAQTLSCGDVTLKEGTSGDITCTFKNNTSGDITFDNPNFNGISSIVSGDSTDVATSTGGSPAHRLAWLVGLCQPGRVVSSP